MYCNHQTNKNGSSLHLVKAVSRRNGRCIDSVSAEKHNNRAGDFDPHGSVRWSSTARKMK